MNNIKKICAILLIGCMLIALSACGKTSADNENPDANNNYYENEEQDNHAENDDADSKILSSTKKDGLLFSTEYTVEDYVENAIIASKNDGLLYGVLDNNGNEVIPIKYDRMYFLNKDNYVERDDNAYILATYENSYTVFNTKGNIILESSDIGIGCIESKIKTGNDDSIAFFIRN